MTTTKEVKNLNWVEKVIARLKMDDNGKVLSFSETVKKEWKKQVAIREEQLKKLKAQYDEDMEAATEILAEFEEEKLETVETIDLEKIGTRDERVAYFKEVYNHKVDAALAKVQRQKDHIKNVSEMYEATVGRINKEKASFEEKLALVE